MGSTAELRLAEEIGEELARQGAVLVSGGLGGIMEAACRGAKKEGGSTVGILPGTEPRAANPHVDLPIPTGLGYARNVLVVYAGEAAIAVGGKFGTLSEIAFALHRGMTVVGLGTWKLDPERLAGADLLEAASPREAVRLALAAAKRFRNEQA